MQDAPDITGAGCKYDFTWLYALETRFSGCNVQWCDPLPQASLM